MIKKNCVIKIFFIYKFPFKQINTCATVFLINRDVLGKSRKNLIVLLPFKKI